MVLDFSKSRADEPLSVGWGFKSPKEAESVAAGSVVGWAVGTAAGVGGLVRAD